MPGVLVLIGVGAVHHSVGGPGISDAAVAIWIRGLGSALFHLNQISVLPVLGVSVDSGISSLSGTETVHRNPECRPWKSLEVKYGLVIDKVTIFYASIRHLGCLKFNRQVSWLTQGLNGDLFA